MADNPVFRPACARDGRFIAAMIDVSSDGVALIEWTEEAQQAAGRMPLDIGAETYASGEGDYSFRNCWIAELSGQRAGILPGFPMGARPPESIVAPPFDGSDVLAPHKYLEAPDTWYICGVAVVPEYRGLGIGTALMQLAREQALVRGYDRLGLVVFEENAAAVRLYRRLGYEVIDQAPVVPHPLIRYQGNVLLMAVSVKG